MPLSEKDILDMVRREYDGKMQKLKDTYGKYMGPPNDEEGKKEKDKEEDKLTDPDDKDNKDNKGKDNNGDKDDEKPKKPEHLKVDAEMNGLLSRGLRLRHKHSDLEYTILSVSPRDVILMTPEGRPFSVSTEEVEKEYELD